MSALLHADLYSNFIGFRALAMSRLDCGCVLGVSITAS